MILVDTRINASIPERTSTDLVWASVALHDEQIAAH